MKPGFFQINGDEVLVLVPDMTRDQIEAWTVKAFSRAKRRNSSAIKTMFLTQGGRILLTERLPFGQYRAWWLDEVPELATVLRDRKGRHPQGCLPFVMSGLVLEPPGPLRSRSRPGAYVVNQSRQYSFISNKH